MRFLILIVSGILGFCTILGVVAVGFAVAMTSGGIDQNDLAMVREGVGKAYVSGLKGVEQTARRLRGDYCAGEQPNPKGGNCG